MKIQVAIIGFGRMGRFYLQEFQKNPKYEVCYICDVSPVCRDEARRLSPESKIVADSDEIFSDTAVRLVVLSAVASDRKARIEQSLRAGKHVIAEKPIADTIEHEREVVQLASQSDLFCTVNLYLRNAWYHHTIKQFVDSGEIGDLAILRICHMTPGLAPGEGHSSEGPSFHDCGMHYVDLARWYAASEYKTWHAQGVRMWNYRDPWWLQCHGTFENGVVFDITQGFVYGQLSKDQTHNSYIDVIGTKGVARMTHDFHTAKVELRGVTQTIEEEKDFGGKNIDVLIELMAESILTGKRDSRLPSFADAAIASEYSWAFFNDSLEHDLPVKGDLGILEEIRERRRNMTDGYGILPRK